MSITVTGIGPTGQAYAARIGLTPDEFESGQGIAYGETVRTDPLIAAALKRDHGKDVPLTPTGPTVTLHDYDTNSVLAWLRRNTRVLNTEVSGGGELPGDSRIDPLLPDVVY
jgi:hypothetical protein